jgi:hypothetical protein
MHGIDEMEFLLGAEPAIAKYGYSASRCCSGYRSGWKSRLRWWRARWRTPERGIVTPGLAAVAAHPTGMAAVAEAVVSSGHASDRSYDRWLTR